MRIDGWCDNDQPGAASAPQVEAELAVANEESEDVFALPEVYEPVNHEYDETLNSRE